MNKIHDFGVPSAWSALQPKNDSRALKQLQVILKNGRAVKNAVDDAWRSDAPDR
ncbi:hypothetical protein L0128_20940 [candidate division KSB1 bacterium]|nr:hypothetical protein [candidate division KSB1 bacterium]